MVMTVCRQTAPQPALQILDVENAIIPLECVNALEIIMVQTAQELSARLHVKQMVGRFVTQLWESVSAKGSGLGKLAIWKCVQESPNVEGHCRESVMLTKEDVNAMVGFQVQIVPVCVALRPAQNMASVAKMANVYAQKATLVRLAGRKSV